MKTYFWKSQKSNGERKFLLFIAQTEKDNLERYIKLAQ
jgi:hypothetical protein